MDEIEQVRKRYEARTNLPPDRYSFTKPDVLFGTQHADRALIKAFRHAGIHNFKTVSLIEVGAGGGANLLRFLRWGMRPENLVASELLGDRATEARHVLPPLLEVVEGDINQFVTDRQFDVVYQSTVLSSILDDRTQNAIAERMWSLLRPGGIILSYDFVVGNPRNPDVRGVPTKRIRELFPTGELRSSRTTLAPPIARNIGHSALLYNFLHTFRPLRTHAVTTIQKPRVNRPSP